MGLSPVTWPTHRRGRPHRRAAGAAHRPWRMISKISGCEYAVSRENGTCGAVPAPPGWRKQAKAVLGARFPVRCAGLATTESRSRRADRVLVLAAAARRGDLTGRGHEDGKSEQKWLRQFEGRRPQRPHAWPERAIQRDIARTQMRWFYMAVVAALAAATLIFAVQKSWARYHLVPRLVDERPIGAPGHRDLPTRYGHRWRRLGTDAVGARRLKAHLNPARQAASRRRQLSRPLARRG